MNASPSSLSRYPMVVFFRLCFSLCSCLLVGMFVCLFVIGVNIPIYLSSVSLHELIMIVVVGFSVCDSVIFL